MFILDADIRRSSSSTSFYCTVRHDGHRDMAEWRFRISLCQPFLWSFRCVRQPSPSLSSPRAFMILPTGCSRTRSSSPSCSGRADQLGSQVGAQDRGGLSGMAIGDADIPPRWSHPPRAQPRYKSHALPYAQGPHLIVMRQCFSCNASCWSDSLAGLAWGSST